MTLLEAYLVMALVVMTAAAVLLYSGCRHWYALMVREQEAHLRTRRQLYEARQDAYWWHCAAMEYQKEVEKGASRDKAC